MHSPNRPAPDLRERILAETLAEVRKRRSRRQGRGVALTSLVIATLSLAWWVRRPDTTSRIPIATAPDSRPRVTIERVAQRPLDLVQRSSRSSTIERIGDHASAADGMRIARVSELTDEQLLASLPEELPAALVKNDDGTARFFILH